MSPGDVSRIANYVARQEEHHKKFSTEDELNSLLKEVGIEIDERYFE